MYSTKGIADITGCLDGKFFAIEVKKPGGRLTDLQQKFMDEVLLAGGTAMMATSVAEVRRFFGWEVG